MIRSRLAGLLLVVVGTPGRPGSKSIYPDYRDDCGVIVRRQDDRMSVSWPTTPK